MNASESNTCKFWLVASLCLALQMSICIYACIEKNGFYCDEIMSYGLSNCEDFFLINDVSTKQYGYNGWVDADYFKNYVNVNVDKMISFSAAYTNQQNDTHPPMYYFLLHIVCYLTGGEFTKWTGLGLNIFLLLLLDLVMFNLSFYLLKNRYLAILSILLWSLSSSGISNIIFIRMYLMLTLEVIAYVALHIRFFGSIEKDKRKNGIYLLVSVVFGGLTHYYFYVFAFFFSAPICVGMLIRKKYKDIRNYLGILIGGFVINLTVFFFTIMHLFKNRGSEVLKNLSTGRTENVFGQYLKWINDSFFGGFIIYFVIIMIICLIVYLIFKNKTRVLKSSSLDIEGLKENRLCISLLAFTIFGFSFIAVKGSQLISNRYIYPIYPFLAIIVIWMIQGIIRKFTLNRVILYLCPMLISSIFCIFSIVNNGIENQYKDDKEILDSISDLYGRDCIYYEGESSWIDTYSTLTMSLNMDETYILNKDEVDSIEEILNNRKTIDNKIIIWIPQEIEDPEDILNKIVKKIGHKSYRFRFDHIVKMYELE